MTKINRKNVIYAIGVAALLVIAYYSRAFHTKVDEPILKMLLVMIRSVIQISLVIAWCSSVRTRIINKQVRHYLIAVGILLAFWLILKTCKWEFIAQNGTHLGRYLWYSHFYANGICPNSNIPPIFFSALLYPECTAFLPNLHTRQKHGTGTDALRKL